MNQLSNYLLEASSECSTVVELLRLKSFTQPERDAFTFLVDGEIKQAALTYQQLDRLSRRIAVQLQARGLTGERALLLYPPGLDYLAAFFGCLYAGVIAVPAYPPRNQRNTPRIQAIADDAQAAIALTTTAILSTVQPLLTQKTGLISLQWLTTDNLAEVIEDTWQQPLIDKDTLAFLQYTSGSTGTPKGVMLSHGNLLHNAAVTYQYMGHSSSSQFVSWLPAYHDMGLIGGILQPLYGGFPCILMPPASFLQRPYRWLKAISDYKGTTSGGPNFAYELCVQKITPEQRSTLDLSSWSVAFNGAEPIRHETLERFAKAFAECGFRPEAFYPCYGMAEATLMVSGGVKAAIPMTKTVQKTALEQNRVIDIQPDDSNSQSFVSCGQTLPEQQIIIVNPETLTRCSPDEVGEIWVSGPSVGKGYWNRLEETQQIFHACVRDGGFEGFLRTGDLGFLDNGEVFITGRAKDLIIIRGRNLYPQDIELTVERSYPSLRSESGAAFTFTVELDNEEKLVVVQELEFRAKPNIEEVIAAIRQAVAEEHEVQVYAVVLIKGGSIPKTSSGKIQRRATRAEFLAGNLEVVGSNILKRTDIALSENRLQRSTLLALPPQECQPLLESYLVELLVQVLSIAPYEVNPEHSLTALGLDSLKVFELKNRIEVDLELEVSVADFFEGMSVRALATKILAELTTVAIPSLSLTQQQATSTHSLSFAEQGLWFVNQLTPDTPTYNIPIVINLKGWINIIVLQDSLNEIVRRHEVLRTNFVVVNEQPVQVINQAVSLTLAVEDLRSLSESARTQEAQRLATKFAQQPFDLSSSPLLRVKLLRFAEKDYQLLVTLHHIIADGWSVSILVRELAVLYEAFSTGKPSPLSELPIQYRDFTYWQRQWLDSERIQPLLAYWKQKLSGELTVLNLPTDRPRSPVQTFKGARDQLVLPQTLKKELKNLSRQQGVTLFMTLLTAFKILLYRYTGQTDILVGSPIASRNRTEIESLIGFFVNVLVLRTDLSGELSFQELLARVKSTALKAYVHQDLPFEKLVEELQPTRDLSYNPLFQVMFVLQNVPKPNLSLSDVSVSYEEGYNGTSKFDLTLFIEDSEQGLIATCEYNTDLFIPHTIARMLGHFETLLESIVSDPEQDISKLQLLTPPEVQQLLVEWNDTKTDYPQDKCIHQLFEAQVEKTPSDIAVIFENQQLTYLELNNRANQLANHLQELGVKPEVIVGICMKRSPEMAIALLAILKAGGTYVPLDPAYPQERLAFMLEDSQAKVLLTQTYLVDFFDKPNVDIVCIDRDSQLLSQQSAENLFSEVKSHHLAYVIYTSGSTGVPKGVAIEHQSCVALLTWSREVFTNDDLAGVLASTSICFDLSIFELFVPLSWGGTVILVENALHLPSVKAEVSLVNTVPSIIAELLQVDGLPPSVRTVNLAGEPLQNQLVQQIYQNDRIRKVLNLYGPSEDTTYSTFAQVNKGDRSVTIGRPIANTQIYLLDTKLQPVPIGVPGEIYIGGAGLARGYLNRSELTKERFIPNPFNNKLKSHLYKTGDLARYLADGNLEYLGRADHQVKIRGFRIELGEIENALLKHPAVRKIVVVVREDKAGVKQLVAYIVSLQGQIPTVSELRKYLKELLPDYMIPGVFIFLDTLPMLPNGKVDRCALPVPESLRPTLTTIYQVPQTEMEQQIAKLWQEVLYLDKVGINDNFFDLGGHSLLMLQVNNKLRAILQRDISVVTMFQNPTINSLAEYLSQQTEEKSIFEPMRERVQKQMEARHKQKQLLIKQPRNNSR